MLQEKTGWPEYLSNKYSGQEAYPEYSNIQ